MASLLIVEYNADVKRLNKAKKTPIDVASPVVLDALRREGTL